MRSAVKTEFFVSLAVHAAVALGLYLALRSGSEPQKRPPLWIEVEVPRTSGKIARTRPAPAQGSSHQKIPGIGLKHWNITGAPTLAPEGPATGDANSDALQVARGMSFERESELLPFLDALWRKLDRRIVFPDSFVKNREEARVILQVAVDHRGRFTGDLREVQSESPGLMTYATAMTVLVLDEALPETFWRPEGEKWLLALDFRFKLKITGGDPLPESLSLNHPVDRMKNLLVFQRDAWVEPSINQAVHEAMAKFFPPILPIPGGVIIDVVRTYELIQNLANRGKRPSSLERSELQRTVELEKWRTIIKKRLPTSEAS